MTLAKSQGRCPDKWNNDNLTNKQVSFYHVKASKIESTAIIPPKKLQETKGYTTFNTAAKTKPWQYKTLNPLDVNISGKILNFYNITAMWRLSKTGKGITDNLTHKKSAPFFKDIKAFSND